MLSGNFSFASVPTRPHDLMLWYLFVTNQSINSGGMSGSGRVTELLPLLRDLMPRLSRDKQLDAINAFTRYGITLSLNLRLMMN
jgi:hypothetical protein